MTEYKQDDGDGHSITYLDTDGYTTCTFGKPTEIAKRIREMTNFKCRPDDIFICAPVKSGTHWTWEIISMMFKGKAETIERSKIENMLEGSSWDLLESLPSPRVLNTHVYYSRLPEKAKELGCKMIYVLRNPKDLAVSLYNHTKAEYNSWFEYVLEWEREMSTSPELPIHLVYYEDLKENSLLEVSRLGRFLGVDDKDGLFEAISRKCQFDNMAKDKQEYLYPCGDEETFSFYRKGDVGDWKNWFTVAQNEHFDKVYSKMMKTSKHKFRYERMKQMDNKL